MSTRARNRAFALCCLAIAATVAALVTFGDRGERPAEEGPVGRASRPARPRPPRAPVATAPRAPRIASLPSPGPRARPPLREEGLASPAYLAREEPRVVRSARAFLEALYAYEGGERSAPAGRTLRLHARPALARRLLAGRARVPAAMNGRPPQAEIVGLSAEFDQPPTTAVVRVKTRRGELVSVSGVILVKEGGRWLVQRMTE